MHIILYHIAEAMTICFHVVWMVDFRCYIFLMLPFFYIRTNNYCRCWVLYFVGHCSLSVSYIKDDDDMMMMMMMMSTQRQLLHASAHSQWSSILSGTSSFLYGHSAQSSFRPSILLCLDLLVLRCP